ncbi:NADP-dependent oxidoreductase [Streptomyces radicis]|uniref:NADP-dependent oxidoreductase n=1 Tax=Streptomyces radicis TaxID=1750517 RepID=A0A3A9WGF5_9ACTN|nr:NADP-dependent oxidoreductase [Streptomyces radicis]RKN12035.1 NADP-dependent oxidoreductase [Streptomyces radicis]RKN25914.1 NADP-dependent oxidoreductase [Streptomyces radicis]
MSLAVQFSEYGATDVLRVVDVPPPTAGPGQVRLAVRAAGVNPIDWKILHGHLSQVMPLDLPGGLGSDVAGVVDQVGEGVTTFSVGDEVLGASITPSYARSALADPAVLVARPPSVPWEVAGALAGAGITAWEALNKLEVAEGETLLVHAAAGGVGTFAVQLAVARGARVIGTASEGNHERLRSLGAEPVTYGKGLVERVRAVSPRGVDAVLDASGRGEIPDSIELAGGPARVLSLVAFDAAGSGIRIHRTEPGAGGRRALGEILALIEAGRLRVPIQRAYPLGEVAAALEVSRSGHLSGKLVLLPG